MLPVAKFTVIADLSSSMMDSGFKPILGVPLKYSPVGFQEKSL